MNATALRSVALFLLTLGATAHCQGAVTLKLPVGTENVTIQLDDSESAVQLVPDKNGLEITLGGNRGSLALAVDPDAHCLRLYHNGAELSGREVSLKVEGKPILRAQLDAEKKVAAGSDQLQFTAWDYAADENGVAGSYQRQEDGSWAELKNGQAFAQFKEAGRTAEYLELFDEKRPLSVRLSRDQMSWSSDGREWHSMYKGAPRAEKTADKPAQNPAAANAIQFTAWDYTGDENGGAGSYQRQEDGSWTEFKNNKSFAHFKETSRTADYLELFDESRPMYVRLSRDQMSWSRDGKEWHTMYKGAPRTDKASDR